MTPPRNYRYKKQRSSVRRVSNFGAVSQSFVTKSDIENIPVLKEMDRKWHLFVKWPNPSSEDWQNIMGMTVNVAQSAWRLFYLYPERLGVGKEGKQCLHSLFKPGVWHQGFLHAECLGVGYAAQTTLHDEGESVPATNCTCGVYATWDKWVVMQYVEGPTILDMQKKSIVLARVAPSAPYIPAEKGWRASGAVILDLYTFESHSEKEKLDINAYADYCGISVTDFSEKQPPKIKLLGAKK